MAPLRTKSEGRNFEDLLSEQDRTEFACSSRTSKGRWVGLCGILECLHC